MFAVIMAGGSGTRFWPISRKQKPKQFLNIAGKETMVVETCNRLSPLIKDEELIVILGEEHLGYAQDLFMNRPISLVAEPVGRNTAACIGLGAIWARQKGYNDPVAFLPADHYIGNPKVFLDALGAAGELAKSGGIVTLGIVPSRPETGYGYIHRKSAYISINGQNVYEVSEFVEKPNLETALSYLRTGDYYWNAGIFVAKPDILLSDIKQLLPDLYNGLLRLEEVWGTPAFEEELKIIYNGLKGISFDYGIMEKTRKKIFAVPCECSWSDVGSWSSLYELKSIDYDNERNLVEGNGIMVDCKGCFVSSQSGRQVTCLGLENCLVADTPDALLVTELNRSQDIRRIVDELKKTGREELL